MPDRAPPRVSAAYLVLGRLSCVSPTATAIACGAWREAPHALVVSVLWTATTGFALLRMFPRGGIAANVPDKFRESHAHAGCVLVGMLCILAALMIWGFLSFALR